ncbi:Na+/H+ antiporter NhaA [Pajaroellobacter abortibovis]|uniref:Na(+)/H(+) antiporter NhaA n=1 Tax=Pajaroellobacter abortibovis TaxID=1882918 RepID=A0A1L6MYD0_9BACT|nr:Na+/H+ antiporter NhaA [Pajaroellobacter abortibovis]APS00457.1 Na+/H+ antiporter NhaA [Pajaroellobacter abortibovis]
MALIDFIRRFSKKEEASGVILLIATCIALISANSPFAAMYTSLWNTPLILGNPQTTPLTLHFIVSEGLMTLFFLRVGLEIRGELKKGKLASWKNLALPTLSAIGGMLVPCFIYCYFNTDPYARRGWGIPTATDIAFAVGVLQALGRRIPSSLRIFLLTFAVLDDIGAIVTIALFYSSHLSSLGLVWFLPGLCAIWLLVTCKIHQMVAYLFPAVLIWIGVWQLGIHPTLAGLILGLLLPIQVRSVSFAKKMQQTIDPWVLFGVMPLFALANAGIHLGGLAVQHADSWNICIGITIALLVGKPLGIIAAGILAIHCYQRKGGTSSKQYRELIVGGSLGGIGFTMSLLITTLAFPASSEFIQMAKCGVLLGSSLSASAGILLGRLLLPIPRSESSSLSPHS